MRLAGSTSPDYGRVEIHNGQRWEAVCDVDFDDVDARVVCSSLEYATGRSQCCSSLGPLPMGVVINVANMTCGGLENRPQECEYSTDTACSSNRYASVLCSAVATTAGNTNLN